MRKTSKEKGITLVALIITIIVMMILVGVSASMIINSDLLGTAQNAGIKFRDNMDAEQIMGTGNIQIGEKTWDEYMQSICNHEFGEWVVVSEPESIYVDGERYRDCEKCGIRQTETIKMNECEGEHTYGEYIIDTAATCQAKGEQHKICSTCGKKVTEEIAVDETAHQYENGACTLCGAEEPTTGLTAAEIAVMSRETKKNEYYGKKVDYGVTYSDQSQGYGEEGDIGAWEILYIGASPANPTVHNIFLITRGFLTIGRFSSSGLTSSYLPWAYRSEQDLAKFPALSAGWLYKTYDPSAEQKLLFDNNSIGMRWSVYLLNSENSVWSGLRNSKADWVIGTPTAELLVAAYNDYYDAEYSISIKENQHYNYGLPTSFFNSDQLGDYLTRYTPDYPLPERYWVACPYR